MSLKLVSFCHLVWAGLHELALREIFSRMGEISREIS